MQIPKSVTYILAGALLIICFFWNRSCTQLEKAETQNTNYVQANDSMKHKINDLGQEITSTAVVLGDYNVLKNKLHSSDSTIKKLQALIDKHTMSATILNSKTTDKGTTHTTITGTEKVIKHDSIFIYPTYESSWTERWSIGHVKANKDSITREVTLFNEYDIKQSYKKQDGFWGNFKARQPVVEVTNLNPMTKTTALKSFVLAPDKKHKGRTLITGIVIGFIGYFALTKVVP